MHKFVVTASLLVFAAVSANCGSSSSEESGSAVAPSSIEAAKGGNGGKPSPGTGSTGGGTISPYKMVEDLNGDGLAGFRDTVTFDVQTSATAYPYVTLKCSQGGRVVSTGTNAMFAGSLDRDFTLGPTGYWTGGSADCTATLEKRDAKGNATVLASTSFTTN